jgi:hypothetical protein
MGMASAVLAMVTPWFDEVQVTVKFEIGAPLLDGDANVAFKDPDATLTIVGFPGIPGVPATMAVVFGVAALPPIALRATIVNR